MCESALPPLEKGCSMDPSESEPQVSAAGTHQAGRGKRLAVLAVFVAAIAALLSTGVQDYLSFDALRENRQDLLAFVAANRIAAAAVFMAVYIAAVTFSVPGAVWLSVAGGFAFGAAAATACIVVAATIGATLVFLIARYVLGDTLRSKAGGAIERMRSGFQENAFSYLLVLRLVPLFPFFIVNLVPAFLNVPLRTYIAGTAIGIIPGAFVYALVGSGLGAVFDAGGNVDPGAVLVQPQVIGSLIGLAVLVLLPVVYKRFRSARHG
jgi:uncharacterized membrane protein YdjX (TVP38/TMEM64 family)